jgi:putative heme-binding domain-containing protein
MAQQENREDVKNPVAGDEKALEAGRNLYMTSCSGCHGPTGEGGRGVRLAQNGDIRGATNTRLFDSIKNGVRGSDMPASPYPEDKIWQLVSYVRSINASAYESKLPGVPEKGALIFDGKGGCRGCHMIRGKGGVLGPDLSHIGVARSMVQLHEAIAKPSERPTEGYTGVEVTTRTGTVIKGVAKDNTNYNISVLDAKGTLHVLRKVDLKAVVFAKESPMPADYAKRLSKEEMNDLIAFLSRQAVRIPKSDETGKEKLGHE